MSGTQQLSFTGSGMAVGADVSDDGRYRTRLWRIWDGDAPLLGWVMLNPSTADAAVDDPTIRRCVGFARRGGFGGIEVANLFTLRATNPAELLEVSPQEAEGPGADRAIVDVARGRTVVAAWGAIAPVFHGRARHVATLLADPNLRCEVVCVGTTASGAPRHPLYVAGGQPFEPWRWPS